MPLLPDRNAPATLTEKTLADQQGKVFLVTGSSAGIGLQLVEILYAHNARIYIAARSAEKSKACIDSIVAKYPGSKGELRFLFLDLTDLVKVKASAQEFLKLEDKLHALWNNAGVMIPPKESKTVQNYDLQLGTNCLGPFLFTKMLTPLLLHTAQSAPPASVRVLWVSSSAAERFSPNGGVVIDNLDYHVNESQWHRYGVSKAGSILYAAEFSKRYKGKVVSLSIDPGNLKTDLYKNMPRVLRSIAGFLALHDPIYGAYTELYAGLSQDITEAQNGSLIQPWGKIGEARADIKTSTLSKAEGGTGIGKQIWDWSEKQVALFK